MRLATPARTVEMLLRAFYEGTASDGPWVAHIKAQKPYSNAGQLLRQALEKGVQVKICNRCAEARDVTAGDAIEGIPLVGLFDFTEWLRESDKVLTFTG